MSRDRDIAEAISEGINCIHAIATALAAGAPKAPDPAWVTTLQEMERALDDVMASAVTTSMVVSEEERDRVRRVRAWVADWTTTDQPPTELQPMAEAILRSLGLRA